jgi:predicted nucleic acid-binding protein
VNRYLVDSNVFLYARGNHHHYREPCRAVLRAAARGHLVLEASVGVVQEFAHVLLRRGVDRTSALEEIDEVRSQCRVHAFDVDVLTRALTLLRAHPTLGVRDAVHAATAIHAGLASIVSADHAFDTVEDVKRVDPAAPDAPWLEIPRPDGP